MFNVLFIKNNYLFVLLKYLSLVSKIKYLVLKKNIFENYFANIGKCGFVLKILLYKKDNDAT